MRPLLLALAVAIAACSSPTVSFPDNTPADFTELAETVFADFVTAFPAREDCIGRVEISAAWSLDDRALYDPDTDIITVRVPGTASQLSTSIVHELGHRLEHRCPAQTEARTSFLEAQGLSPESTWADPASYETNPSELWAEAVVRHVLGKPDSRRPLDVKPAAVDVVAAWSNGELNHGPSAP